MALIGVRKATDGDIAITDSFHFEHPGEGDDKERVSREDPMHMLCEMKKYHTPCC